MEADKNAKSIYLERKEEELARGHPFFPETVFKDIVAATVILLVIVGLAAWLGAPLELEANPTGAAKAPRPEWYFLFLFEALKYMPGELEWVGAVLLPGVLFVALFCLPFLDRSPWRHPLNRPLASGLTAVALVVVALLNYRAATSPEPPAVGAPAGAQLTPLEQAGKNVYDTQRCAVCHKINAVGGDIGPDLSTVGRRLDASWLVAHLERPAEATPGTKMPQIALTNDELMALTAYLLSLKEPETRTPAQLGEALFSVYCSTCHPGGKAGIGPSLAGVSPDKANAMVRLGGRGMPAFKPGDLGDEQLAQIVAFLRTLR